MWKNVNSEFAEHPPSLDTIRPLCNASIIFSFLCSFLSPPELNVLAELFPVTVLCPGVYINVFFVF